MKNALILHGTDNTSQNNWFPWLKAQLEEKGHGVWVPDLPRADEPNIARYNELLLSGDFDYGDETMLVGHSSGAVAILGLLEALPDEVVVDTAVLVGSFKDDLGWEKLAGLFEKPFDLAKIKTKAKRFVFFHSDNDPYCPLEHAEYLSEQLGGELIVKSGQAHFSVKTAGEKYREFPEVLKILSR
ncbi:alpha/beta hydrolase [Candidatus Nomurabacteria bacterium]|nr:alpha/beta hydrolase [Candidatus Nomurabacteria bacterium]